MMIKNIPPVTNGTAILRSRRRDVAFHIGSERFEALLYDKKTAVVSASTNKANAKSITFSMSEGAIFDPSPGLKLKSV